MGKEVKPVGQLLREMLKAYRIDERAAEMKIKEHWPEIVGDMVSKNTGKIYLRKDTLHVHISNSVIRHEVSYHQQVLLERIASLTGFHGVKQIKLLA